MTNGKYVSVETIIAGAYRDLGLSDQINLDDAVEWIGEAVELIGTPLQLLDKIDYIPINEYRGKLPCELHYIVSVNAHPGMLRKENCLSDLEYRPMRYSTDTFHHRYCNNVKHTPCAGDLTYKVNDDYIFPNFSEGAVAIAYKAVPVDERGFPKVPDDIKFKRAVTDYLKWKLAFIEWSKGKMVGPVYNHLEQEKLYSMGAAQTRGHMPSIDQMESIKNNWLRLIPKINQHADNFKSTGSAEQRLLHNNYTSGSRTTNQEKDGGTFFHNS